MVSLLFLFITTTSSDIQDSEMIGKLTEDAAKGGKGPIKIVQTSNPLASSVTTTTTIASDGSQQ